MIDAATRALLEFAVNYIGANNDLVTNAYTNPRTREIEPGGVRREVVAANAWLERARRALKPIEKVEQDVIPAKPDCCPDLIVAEHEGMVRIEAGDQPYCMLLSAEKAGEFAGLVIKHARIAGRKTGRIVEVKL